MPLKALNLWFIVRYTIDHSNSMLMLILLTVIDYQVEATCQT